MTLIIKELIIQGVVSKDDSSKEENTVNLDKLQNYLQEMRKEIENQCIETVLEKIESSKQR